MSIALADLTTSFNLFLFDVEEEETRNLKLKWTTHPIESGQDISDYAWLQPRTFTVVGSVTAWPFDLADQYQGSQTQSAIDYQRPTKLLESLEDLAKKAQPVSLICKYWTKAAVIEEVSSKPEVDLLQITCKLRTYVIPKAKYTNIAASRLKAGRKGASSRNKTGNKTKKVSDKKKGNKTKGNGYSGLGKKYFGKGRTAGNKMWGF